MILEEVDPKIFHKRIDGCTCIYIRCIYIYIHIYMYSEREVDKWIHRQ